MEIRRRKVLPLIFFFGLSALSSFAGMTEWGAHGIAHLASQAAQQADEIRSPRSFAQSLMDDYRFYTVFVNYNGSSRLKDPLLGSWEFADRIENLFPYWSPADHHGIQRVRELAAAARRRQGVLYDRREANRSPREWWKNSVLGGLTRLVHGEALESHHHLREWKILAAAILEADLVVQAYHLDQSRRHLTEGKLASSTEAPGFGALLEGGGLLFKEFVTSREGESRIVDAADAQHPVRVLAHVIALSLQSDSPLEAQSRLFEALQAPQVEKILGGERLTLPPGTSARSLKTLKRVLDLLNVKVADLDAAVQDKNKLSSEKLVLQAPIEDLDALAATLPREKGVQRGSCEATL